MNRKAFFAALVLLTGLMPKAWAYDFSAIAPSGQTLYYSITSTGVTVTCPGNNDWYGFTEPTGSLVIPASVIHSGTTYTVESIDYMAFRWCSNLTSVTIPNTVVSIGGFSFMFSGITSLTIPPSVTTIGERAFDECTALTSVAFNADSCISVVQPFGASGSSTITSFTFGSNVKVIPYYLCKNLTGLTSVSIPCQTVGGEAFMNCTGLTSVTLSNSVTNIYVNAFKNCSNLASITIPASVNFIGSYAFQNCTGLTSIAFNADSCTAGLMIFNGCTNIANITFGNNVRAIPDEFCRGWSSLTSVTLPDSLNTIGGSCFYECTNLTSISIPANVTSIGGHAFYGCTNLTATHYLGTLQQWIGITFGTKEANPIYYSQNFYLGDSLLSQAIIPEGVTNIPAFAFVGDTCLDYISIPSTVTSIGNYAFNGSGPSRYRFYPATPPTLGGYFSLSSTYNTVLIVPWLSLDNYKTATYYTSLASHIGTDSCMLSVNVTNNTIGGTVALLGSPTLTHLYPLFDTASIIITAADHYSLQVESTGCTELGWEDNTYRVYLNWSNAYPSVQVDFIPDTHHISAVANYAGCGTVTGTNDYAYGTTVQVSATAASGYYFVRWADGSTANPATFTCTGDTTVVAIFSPIVTPELCMVSVENDRNVLLWDREELPIVSYTVYREGTTNGHYDAVATIPYAEAGQWTDTASRPINRSYRYRLTATDTCGNESQSGGIHKTMHLTISQGVSGTWNLVWTPYEGADYSTYVIYRGTSASDISQIDIMPSAGNTTYSDPDAPTGEVYYQVGVMMANSCGTPNAMGSTKASTISRSNIASSSNPGGTEGIDDIAQNGIRVWSANGSIHTEGAEGETVHVFDMIGRQVATHNLPAGVYMVKIGHCPARKVLVVR